MIFKADKNKLCDAVLNASKACAVKTVYNGLDCLLLSLKDNKLTITGYDLEMGIKIIIDVDGERDGDILIEAKLFGDIVRKMPNYVPVEITATDDKKVTIKSGNVKFDIQGMSSANYPNVIELNDKFSINLSEKILKGMISQICHAIAQTDINPVLMGALFEIEDGVLNIVSSDSTRLAIRREKVDEKNIYFIVPEKTLIELNRNLTDEEKNVKIIIERNQICFIKEDYIILSRLIDGKFIDYKRITDYKPEKTAIIQVRETIEALDRCCLLINDKLKSSVVCTFKGLGENAVMHLYCRTNLGEIDEELNIKLELNYDEEEMPDDINPDEYEFVIAYNPKFMIDALKNTCCDEVRLLLATEIKPMKIIPMSDDGFMFVVVPVRQKK